MVANPMIFISFRGSFPKILLFWSRSGSRLKVRGVFGFFFETLNQSTTVSQVNVLI